MLSTGGSNHPGIGGSKVPEYAFYFNKSISVSDSTYLPAVTNLANLYVKLDKPQLAIDLCTYALKKSKSKEIELGAYTNWIFALFKQNKFQEASALFEKLEQLHGAEHGESRVFKDIRMNLSIHRHLFDR